MPGFSKIFGRGRSKSKSKLDLIAASNEKNDKSDKNTAQKQKNPQIPTTSQQNISDNQIPNQNANPISNHSASPSLNSTNVLNDPINNPSPQLQFQPGSASLPDSPTQSSPQPAQQQKLHPQQSIPTSFMRARSTSRASYSNSPDEYLNNNSSQTNLNNNSSTKLSHSKHRSITSQKSLSNNQNNQNTQNPQTPSRRRLSSPWDLPDSTPEELIPILTLINSQQARVYIEGFFSLLIKNSNFISSVANTPQNNNSITNTNNNNNSNNSNNSNNNNEFINGYGSLSGNELSIWKSDEIDFKPIYINVADANFINDFNNLTITIFSPSLNNYILKFTSLDLLKKWFSALILSNFEYNCLHEAYTGALLSAKAILLSDVKTLLSETRYSIAEWANIRLNFITSKWFKVYIVVAPSNNSDSKSGSLSIYSSNKTIKKNLLISIKKANSCFAVYPQGPEVIDHSSLMKLDGEITIHNWKFFNNPSNSISSSSSNLNLASISNQNLSSPSNNTNIRSRSSSLNSFVKRKNSNSSLNSHLSASNRNESFESLNITSTSNTTSLNTSLYIIPENHPSVKSFETMIRFMIPVFDAFNLYGRPKKLVSDKSNLNSLLFALPVLPRTKYLNYNDCLKLIDLKIDNKPALRDLSNSNPNQNQNQSNKSHQRKNSKKIKFGLTSKQKSKQDQIDTNSIPVVPEYTNKTLLKDWSNRDWIRFLKTEIKYKLLNGYQGAGDLILDLETAVNLAQGSDYSINGYSGQPDSSNLRRNLSISRNSVRNSIVANPFSNRTSFVNTENQNSDNKSTNNVAFNSSPQQLPLDSNYTANNNESSNDDYKIDNALSNNSYSNQPFNIQEFAASNVPQINNFMSSNINDLGANQPRTVNPAQT
ncbi:uncharacterized protein ASCRUDRAFT_113959 [Ascoidea rubescens DSM 1968]|uniref:Skg3/CAF120-like PH-like domain-containing protein n=1 Tax=Ascoidea rubescens DSM 1968 TaxID=1344418 RepID=A0A1D2VCP1_9ASCO|nr:hypothetical protein ASCRUDRAFT_113959 [Ascoidea rubescens DSM 1968]ODV59227.1 hypothetical protein ASCRUDRAFT_113959 [Ascoidea rubescens DSM 1968]